MSIDELYERAKQGKILSQFEIKWIMQKVIEILVKEPNVKYISASVTIVGDIHGYILKLFIFLFLIKIILITQVNF
jgi:hypothetical protein